MIHINIDKIDDNNLLEKLKADGFTDKFAKVFINRVKEEKKNPLYDSAYAAWALSKGFFLESAYAYNLNEDNYENYLSDYDYYKIWPLNSWCRIWIDDKLTLKYMLEGTEFSNLLPEYYFYSTSNGLRELIDNPYKGNQKASTLITILRDKGELACKPNNGSLSVGFFKLSFSRNKLFINEKETNDEGIASFVKDHSNYIFTEYLHPCKEFSEIHKLIHTLRVVIVNENGNDPKIIGGYMRFGTSGHGNTNHMNIDADSKSDYDFVAEVDFDKGYVSNAKSIYWNKVVDTSRHPESHVLVEMSLPNWGNVKSQLLNLSKYLFNCQYIGIDACFTDDGLKIMEINSHSGIKYIQTFHSLYEDTWVKEWFQSKIK